MNKIRTESGGLVWTHKGWSFVNCGGVWGGTLYHHFYRPVIGLTRYGRSVTVRLFRLTLTARLDTSR